jgi:hypothetical protein
MSGHVTTQLQQAFVMAFDGDTAATAARLNIPLASCNYWTGTDWFKEAMEARAVREAKYVERDRIEMFKEQIASRLEIQALWSRTMKDESVKMENRLAASKLLATSHGMMIEKVEVENTGVQNIVVKKEALEERVLGLSKRRSLINLSMADFLS